MYNDLQLANAMAHFFKEPICYNAIYARALASTKAAILVDYILKRKSLGLPFPSITDIQSDLHFSTHEAKATLLKLGKKRIITIQDGIRSLDPFHVETLTVLAEQAHYANSQLSFDLLTSVDINRLHLQTLKSLGGSINSAILLSFLLDSLPESDRIDSGKLHSEWIQSQDSLWISMSGMSAKEIRSAKQLLRKLKLIEMKKVGFPGQLMIRLNIDLLCQMTWEFTEKYDNSLFLSNKVTQPVWSEPFNQTIPMAM